MSLISAVPRDFLGIPLVTYLVTLKVPPMVGAEGQEKIEIVSL